MEKCINKLLHQVLLLKHSFKCHFVILYDYYIQLSKFIYFFSNYFEKEQHDNGTA